MYGRFFKKDNIILYSPTKNLDKTWDDLKLKWHYGPEDDIGGIVQDVIKQQKEFKEEDNTAPVLIILDDITEIKDAWRQLLELGYTGRHFNIHTLSIAHKMSSIPRGVRTQCQQWILFKPHEQSEWDWILDMFASKGTRDIWEVALHRAWSKKYEFVYIDFERESGDVYHKGFNDPLFTEDELFWMENPKCKPRETPVLKGSKRKRTELKKDEIQSSSEDEQ